jgi:pyridoxal phosphate enzyme (YggS family)
MHSIAENINRLRRSIPEEVSLIAVSKTRTPDEIGEAYAAGQRDFGENYVQELLEKRERLPVDIRWHFIGHLQSKKVKQIAPFVHLIHGVDSVRLLHEINKQGERLGRKISCLLQLHIAQEETKFGFSFEECAQWLRSGEPEGLHHVQVMGLMGMASNSNDEIQIREEFSALRNFRDGMREAHADLNILSFGMSHDYRIAIEEGSSMVRIGSLIFGERNYP